MVMVARSSEISILRKSPDDEMVCVTCAKWHFWRRISMHGDLIIRGPTETSRASQPFALSFQGPSTVPPLYTQTSRAQSPLNPSSSRQIFPYSLSSPLTCVRVRGNLRLHYCVYFYDIAFLKSHFDVMIWNFLWLQFRINSVSSVSKSCLWIQQTFLIINNVYLTQLHLKKCI